MIEGNPFVTLFGTRKAKPGQEPYEIAFELGRELAVAGITIVNGGYGGTMLAAAQGARQAGGEVIGVTCSEFGRSGPNPYVSREIKTHSLRERLECLVDLGKAYVVLPGGTGTLLELAEVWELKNKRLAGRDRPIIIWRSFWEPLVELMRSADPDCITAISPAESVKEILGVLESICG
ncbi:MAG: LOG family protein [Phycisphaerae bacterium]|nr:LOG family protein [Phycisphaerae bacterium]